MALRSLCVMVALAAACEPATPPPIVNASPQPIPVVEAPRVGLESFGPRRVSVGDRWSVRTVAESVADSDAGPGQHTMYDARLEVTVMRVVGERASGPAPSRLELRFAKSVRSYQGQPTPTEVDGRTYILDARETGVRDATGAPVTEKESELVQDAYPDVGTSSRLEQALPDGPLVIGASAPGLAEATLRSLHPRAWSFDGGRAELARVERGAAVFDVVIKATSGSGLHLSVAGEVTFRLADRRQTRLVLRGTYVAGDPQTSGTFELRRDIE